jgi:hypothetical protein
MGVDNIFPYGQYAETTYFRKNFVLTFLWNWDKFGNGIFSISGFARQFTARSKLQRPSR